MVPQIRIVANGDDSGEQADDGDDSEGGERDAAWPSWLGVAGIQSLRFRRVSEVLKRDYCKYHTGCRDCVVRPFCRRHCRCPTGWQLDDGEGEC